MPYTFNIILPKLFLLDCPSLARISHLLKIKQHLPDGVCLEPSVWPPPLKTRAFCPGLLMTHLPALGSPVNLGPLAPPDASLGQNQIMIIYLYVLSTRPEACPADLLVNQCLLGTINCRVNCILLCLYIIICLPFLIFGPFRPVSVFLLGVNQPLWASV